MRDRTIRRTALARAVGGRGCVAGPRLAALVAALALTSSARADVTYFVTIDENGHGSLLNQTTGVTTTLAFEQLLLPNGQANGLQYSLADGATALAATVG